MTIKTDDMDLAGDVIQALCQFLNIDDMQVAADFPEEMEKLRQILVKVRPISKFRTTQSKRENGVGECIRSSFMSI